MVLLTPVENPSMFGVVEFDEKRDINVVMDILRILGKPETLIIHVENGSRHDYCYFMHGDRIKHWNGNLRLHGRRIYTRPLNGMLRMNGGEDLS